MTTTVFSMKWTKEEIEMFFIEKEILYKDFKDFRKDFKCLPAKKDTYNADKKTIVVYYPKFMSLAKQFIDNINELTGEWDMQRVSWLICKATEQQLEERLQYYCYDDEEDITIRNFIKDIKSWRKEL